MQSVGRVSKHLPTKDYLADQADRVLRVHAQPHATTTALSTSAILYFTLTYGGLNYVILRCTISGVIVLYCRYNLPVICILSTASIALIVELGQFQNGCLNGYITRLTACVYLPQTCSFYIKIVFLTFRVSEEMIIDLSREMTWGDGKTKQKSSMETYKSNSLNKWRGLRWHGKQRWWELRQLVKILTAAEVNTRACKYCPCLLQEKKNRINHTGNMIYGWGVPVRIRSPS